MYQTGRRRLPKQINTRLSTGKSILFECAHLNMSKYVTKTL